MLEICKILIVGSCCLQMACWIVSYNLGFIEYWNS